VKIRTGFVSNSSSSSFVITDSGIKTTAETAWMMLSVVLEDICDREADFDSWIKEVGRALKFLESNLNLDEPITFPWSINEETYIWKNSEDKICVDTCNNHPWYEEIKYAFSGDDWKWDPEPNSMDCWHEVEYLNLDTMEKSLRNDWSAKHKRGEGWKLEPGL